MDYSKDYYLILETHKQASKEEIKSSYRRLAKLYHPDNNPNDSQAEEHFKSINEANEILSNDISRQIYNEYRAESNEPIKETTLKPKNQNTKTYQETKIIKREKRIYLFGTIHVKFQGEPEIRDTYIIQREQKYKIYPTETWVDIHHSGIQKDGASKEFQKAYSTADLFAVPLIQPLYCKITQSSGDDYYNLTIYDIKIKNPVFKDITKHEQFSYGTFEGDLYGYIVYSYDEEVTESFTEYFGPTGEVEIKEEAGSYFTREQFFNKDSSVYWTDWKVKSGIPKTKKPNYKTSTSYSETKTNGNWVWLLFLLLILIISAKLFLALFVIFAILFLVSKCFMLFSLPFRFQSFLAAILIVLFAIVGILSLINPIPSIIKNNTGTVQTPIENHKTPLKGYRYDTLISHLVQWSDYDSNKYSTSLSILQSAVRDSRTKHYEMNESVFNEKGPTFLYSELLRMDNNKLHSVSLAFDSISRSNTLNELQTTSMIVSCIQSIPYFLVVDRLCSDPYNDPYVSNYLKNCQSDCCLGNVKFGVQSPAEFISDLKGDCDTRALALFDILSNRGTDVALLTSTYYKHAIIAVHFKNSSISGGICIPINDKNYYLWETTSSGNKPGEISPAISNLKYWNVSLIHQQ